MSWSNVALAVVLALAVVVGLFELAVPHLAERVSQIRAADACDAAHEEIKARVDCWLKTPLDRIQAGSLPAAFRAFSYLYNAYPLFASSGCHRYAHKLGDAAYYEFVVARGLPIQAIRFPQSTTACGYGFFHGFIEHFVQNYFEKQFVVDSCEYLRKEYSSTMRDIGTICYHASGHGFMQAQADALPEAMQGNPDLMVAAPLERCEELPTNQKEIEDCREGVFNVLVDWMETGDFGLAFDLRDPLQLCSLLKDGWQYACFYELAQNLGRITEGNPLKAAQFSTTIRDSELRTMAFGVMVAGMMQSATALDEYKKILAECVHIEDATLRDMCVTSSANGMMEHGSPGKEYEKVLDLCADSVLQAGDEAACYGALSKRLLRFYEPGKAASICGKFPEQYRGACGS